MKIACITEDGHTISQHFGRAPYYLVLTVENDRSCKGKCEASWATNTLQPRNPPLALRAAR